MKKRNSYKVTLNLLEKLDACSSGVEYWQDLPKKHRGSIQWLIKHAIEGQNESVLDDAIWLAVIMMSTKNAQRYAVFAAELALEHFEKYYHDDDRPKKAIEAAKVVIKKNTKENRAAARAAADAAYAAARAAADAAYAAARAAYAAADAAYAAARAAYAAADAAARAAAYAAARAASAADAARIEVKTKCLKHAFKLFGGEL